MTNYAKAYDLLYACLVVDYDFTLDLNKHTFVTSSSGSIYYDRENDIFIRTGHTIYCFHILPVLKMNEEIRDTLYISYRELPRKPCRLFNLLI